MAEALSADTPSEAVAWSVAPAVDQSAPVRGLPPVVVGLRPRGTSVAAFEQWRPRTARPILGGVCAPTPRPQDEKSARHGVGVVARPTDHGRPHPAPFHRRGGIGRCVTSSDPLRLSVTLCGRSSVISPPVRGGSRVKLIRLYSSSIRSSAHSRQSVFGRGGRSLPRGTTHVSAPQSSHSLVSVFLPCSSSASGFQPTATSSGVS